MVKPTAALLLALVLPGCRAPRPSSIERWTACVVERGHVTRAGNLPEIAPGPAPVLYLHARWGDSAFVSEYSWGELMAELPDGLATGATTTFGNGAPPASYREGGQIVGFDTDRLEGTVHVVHADTRQVVLDVDVTAGWPRIDLGKRGVVPARGKITASLVGAARDCR